MRKINVISYLKISLIIFLFQAGITVYANSAFELDTSFDAHTEKLQYQSTNHKAYLKGESKLEYTVVLSYNQKKPIKINFFRINPFLVINEKTNKLYYYSEQIIISSLRSTRLIYPFHSFL